MTAEQFEQRLSSLTYEIQDLQRRMGDVEERRKAQQQLHDDVVNLVGAVREVTSVANRCHEALFAEHEKGEFGMIGLYRQWSVNKRVFLVLITVVPTVVSAAVAAALWAAKTGLLH